MTAAEIVEQIKALPPQEQREVCEFVLARLGDDHFTISPPIHEPIESIAGRIFERYPELFEKLAK
ncbi:MAG: hypothetical protein ABJF10_28550 [Chthoniobacter sp.]|uniref:hypothetical protein n=1 Tax=Chthoniobacter sp. TaxID=2510640 RepID=UPI0032AA98C0